MITELNQQKEVMGKPKPLNEFTKDDFTNFQQTQSQGEDRRSIVAEANQVEYVVKVPRLKYIKYHIEHWYRNEFDDLIEYNPITQEQISEAILQERKLEKFDYEMPEDIIISRILPEINWDTTLKKDAVKEIFNEIELKRMTLAQEAHAISESVVEPSGIYKTQSGWVGEVAPRLIGKHIEEGEYLTEEQQRYADIVVNKLIAKGLEPQTDMTALHNIFVIGDKPEDIRFIEPAFINN